MVLKLSNVHVLIVEDLQPMRDLITSVLKVQGFKNITCATDGQKGFEDFCRFTPDIVLTDWNMPTSDGMELVRKIRTSPQSPNKMVPIILMTGFNSKNKIAEARDFGVTEFLVKPFSANDLSKRMLHIIKSPRDFIITPTFNGPDRRRHEWPTTTIVNRRENSPAVPRKIIKANNLLQAKVGLGVIDEKTILASQSVIDNNKINFAPIATNFLQQLRSSLDNVRKHKDTTHRDIENIALPVMQIKANARVFKYGLLGDLAGTMMGFLDNLKILDNDAIQIVDAHHTTLTHIVHNQMQGDGGLLGSNLQAELEGACRRYMNSRAEMLKDRLRNLVDDTVRT